MKNWMIIITVIALAATSCTKERGCTDSNAINYNPQAIKDDGNCSYASESATENVKFEEIPTSINRNLILNNQNAWLLSGRVEVMPNATLTIQQGTKIYANADDPMSALIIHQGAKIIADGEPNAPIVFTSSRTLEGTQSKGDWGGIIIHGYAPVSSNYRNTELNTGSYGGTNATDNSGVLRNLVVEYAGSTISYGAEHNGISLYGVGSGTTIDRVQIFRCADDGIEMYGGTVNLKHIKISECDDDGIDWTEGWNGMGQFWHITTSKEKANGIEAGTDFFNTNARPVISNVTLINSDNTRTTRGIYFKEGVSVLVVNSYIDGYTDAAVRVSDEATLNKVDESKLWFTHNLILNNGVYFENVEVWENINYFPYALKSYENYEKFPIQDINSWFDTPEDFGAAYNGTEWMHGWTVGSM
jgi:hypothetical protein